jgi:hypothetical protein
MHPSYPLFFAQVRDCKHPPEPGSPTLLLLLHRPTSKIELLPYFYTYHYLARA